MHQLPNSGTKQDSDDDPWPFRATRLQEYSECEAIRRPPHGLTSIEETEMPYQLFQKGHETDDSQKLSGNPESLSGGDLPETQLLIAQGLPQFSYVRQAVGCCIQLLLRTESLTVSIKGRTSQ